MESTSTQQTMEWERTNQTKESELITLVNQKCGIFCTSWRTCVSFLQALSEGLQGCWWQTQPSLWHHTSNQLQHLKTKQIDDPQFQNAFSSMQQTESENEKKMEAARISHGRIWGKSSFSNPMHLKCSRALVEMIALENQPFSIVEDMGFNHYSMTMNPRYDLPSSKWLSMTENQLPN